MAERERRKDVKRAYGELFDRVSAVLFAADPMGLNFGSNTDEYDPEASTIIPRLSGCHSTSDALTVIHEEFVAWFDLDADEPVEKYRQIAEDIWNLWQHFMANLSRTP